MIKKNTCSILLKIFVNPGLTLVEVLIMIAIFSIFLNGLMFFFVQGMRSVAISEDLANNLTEATRLLSFLRADIKKMILTDSFEPEKIIEGEKRMSFVISTPEGQRQVTWFAEPQKVTRTIFNGSKLENIKEFVIPRMKSFCLSLKKENILTEKRDYTRLLFSVDFELEKDTKNSEDGAADLLRFESIISPDTLLYNLNSKAI